MIGLISSVEGVRENVEAVCAGHSGDVLIAFDTVAWAAFIAGVAVGAFAVLVLASFIAGRRPAKS